MTYKQDGIILYRSDDGQATVDVRLQDETVWLTLTLLTAAIDPARKDLLIRLMVNLITEES